jgi:hypothetical protein
MQGLFSNWIETQKRKRPHGNHYYFFACAGCPFIAQTGYSSCSQVLSQKAIQDFREQRDLLPYHYFKPGEIL